MGTLYEQSMRDYLHVTKSSVEGLIKAWESLETEVTFEDYLKAVEVLEYRRRTDFMINNGDRWDEQIAGIGRALGSIAHAISSGIDEIVNAQQVTEDDDV